MTTGLFMLPHYQLRDEFRRLLKVHKIYVTHNIEEQNYYIVFEYQTVIYSIPIQYDQSALEALQNYPELLI